MKKKKSSLTNPRRLTFTYTHRDRSGMLWRFQDTRPVSMLADQVMHTEGRFNTDRLKIITPEKWSISQTITHEKTHPPQGS